MAEAAALSADMGAQIQRLDAQKEELNAFSAEIQRIQMEVTKINFQHAGFNSIVNAMQGMSDRVAST